MSTTFLNFLFLFFQQFTRSFLSTDSMLAGESVHGKLRRERRSMSKKELRSSGKPRRGVFANGAGEL